MRLKASRYMHVCEYEDGLCLAYNALTGQFVRLKTHAIRSALLERQVPRGASHTDVKELESLGFLIDSDIDERVVVREVRRIGAMQNRAASLTVLPTLRCNLACTYCFQRHTVQTMSAEVEEALMHFLEAYVLPASKSLALEWYGGEPLLALPTLERLSRRIAAAAESHGCSLAPVGIITNGTLLSEGSVRRLLKAGVRNAQVTLDGDEAVHNKRRPFVSGQGSFRAIVGNLRTAVSELSVSIRVNVDRENCSEVLGLLGQLRDLGVLDRAAAYVAPVESFSGERATRQDALMTSEEFARFHRSLATRCKERGISLTHSHSLSSAMFGTCIAELYFGFVVKPDGQLVKCWGETDCGTEPIAHLLQPDTLDRLLESEQASSDVFTDVMCYNCNLLPVCMGGCPTLRSTGAELPETRCPPMRYELPWEIRAQYESTCTSGEARVL